MTSRAELGEAWKDAGIPGKQMRRSTRSELASLRAGNPPEVYAIAAEALRAIPGSGKLTLLDMGCATGYYSEAISVLAGDRFEYAGADYSDAMLAVARGKYPDITFLNLDIRHIELPDRAYDVVLSGATLMHIAGWKGAARELARITGSYLILHRTPVTEGKTSATEESAYNVRVLANTFNEAELWLLLVKCGFYNIFLKSVYPKGGNITYVFERLQNHPITQDH